MLIAAVALPVHAAAQNNEYDLNLPGSGSGSDSSGEETTAPVVPIAPAVTDPTITETSDGTGDRKRRRDRDRDQGPTDPVLTTSGVNATAGPQEIPTLTVSDDDGGVPTLALVVASLAAACCILALWRLRFLRELPAAPRPRTPRAEASS